MHVIFFQDFILTVIFGILWLSSSAAWANGLTGLKHVTDPANIDWELSNGCQKCPAVSHSFSTLNISVVRLFYFYSIDQAVEI